MVGHQAPRTLSHCPHHWPSGPALAVCELPRTPSLFVFSAPQHPGSTPVMTESVCWNPTGVASG